VGLQRPDIELQHPDGRERRRQVPPGFPDIAEQRRRVHGSRGEVRMGKWLIAATAGLALLVSPAARAAEPAPVPNVASGAPGETALYAVDPDDKVLLNVLVRVEYDLSRLRESLKQVMGGERIAVNTIEGKLILSGYTSSAGRAERARALAIAAVGDKKADQV